jgi:hypothetical protein
MELGIPIPVLVLEQNDLPVCFSLDMDHRDYEQLFREAGLTIPAELMARELKFGGTKNYRQPTPKDPRGAGKIRVKRIKSNDLIYIDNATQRDEKYRESIGMEFASWKQ